NHQLLTKVMLELRKRSAERGLRQAKLLRRAIDAPQLGNPQKIFKLIEVHARTPDQFRCNIITARPVFEKVESDRRPTRRRPLHLSAVAGADGGASTRSNDRDRDRLPGSCTA